MPFAADEAGWPWKTPWKWPRRRRQVASLRTSRRCGRGRATTAEVVALVDVGCPGRPWRTSHRIDEAGGWLRCCRRERRRAARLRTAAGKLLQRRHVAQTPRRFCRCGRRDCRQSRIEWHAHCATQLGNRACHITLDTHVTVCPRLACQSRAPHFAAVFFCNGRNSPPFARPDMSDVRI